MTSLRFVDWFCGVGGIRLGLERAGHRCVWSCEIDDFARAVYGKRFGNEPEGKDIRAVEAKDIPEADLWVGGFPCQDLSTAGRRAGFEGERSGLVWKLLDLAADARPSWLLLENVPGMFSVDGGRGFGRLLARLDELGFHAAWRTLDARFFGVHQRRRRVFILAGRAGDGTDPASLLLEQEGVRRRPAARGAAREDVAGTLGGGSGARGWCDDLDRAGAFIPEIAGSVSASAGHHGRSSPRGDGCDTMIAATLTSGGNPNSNTPGRHREDDENLVVGALGASTGGPDDNDAQQGRLIPFAVNGANSCAKESHAREVDVARCLDSNGGFASGGQGGTVVAVAVRGRDGGAQIEAREDGTVNALRDGSKGGASAPMIACIHPDAKREGVNKKMTPDAEGNVRLRDPGLGIRTDGAAFTLGTGEPPSIIAFDPTQITHPENRSKCEPGAPAPALAQRARAPHIAYSLAPESGADAELRATETDVAQAVTAAGNAKKNEKGTRIVQESGVRRLTPRECERLQGFPDDWTLIQVENKKRVKCPTCDGDGRVDWLTCDDPECTSCASQEPHVCPTCNGKKKITADLASDARRYKVIGNSVAVPVLAWIGGRLATA